MEVLLWAMVAIIDTAQSRYGGFTSVTQVLTVGNGNHSQETNFIE